MKTEMRVYYVAVVREVMEDGEKVYKVWYESGPYYTLNDALDNRKKQPNLFVVQADLPVTVLF
jgi:hypothetical protein